MANSQTLTNRNNFRIQDPSHVREENPELIAVTSGAYAASDHTPNPLPMGYTVTGTYESVQFSGHATLHSTSTYNGVTLSKVFQMDPLVGIRTVITLDRTATAPTASSSTELRIRAYNTNNTNSLYQGLVPNLNGNLFQQSPVLSVDLCNQNLVQLPLSSTILRMQGRLLADGTIALTYITSTGAELPLTTTLFNTIFGQVGVSVAVLSVYGPFISGIGW